MPFNSTITPQSAMLTVANNSNFGGANLTTFNDLAVSLAIDGSKVTSAISCQLNGTATFKINPGQTYGWGYQDLQITSLDFANSSGSSQTVQFIAGVVNV